MLLLLSTVLASPYAPIRAPVEVVSVSGGGTGSSGSVISVVKLAMEEGPLGIELGRCWTTRASHPVGRPKMTVAFQVQRTGRFRSVKVKRSSGFEDVDTCVENVLKAGQAVGKRPIAYPTRLKVEIKLPVRPTGPDFYLPLDPAIRHGTLDNGLRYWIRHVGNGGTTARLRVAWGANHEAPDFHGGAHLLEHLAFNGTTNLTKDAIDGLREGSDTHLNASTTPHDTVFELWRPHGASLDDMFLLLSDWAAAGLKFDDASLETERRIVQEEIRLRDTPASALAKKMDAALEAGAVGAGRSVGGTAESVAAIDRASLESHLATGYRYENIDLVITTVEDGKLIEAGVKKYFSTPSATTPEGPSTPVFEVPTFEGLEVEVVRQPDYTGPVRFMWMGAPAPRTDDHGLYRDRAIDAVAMGLLEDRLRARLGDDNALWSVFVEQMPLSPNQTAFTIVGTVDEADVDAGLRTVSQTIRQAAEHGFTQDELDAQREAELTWARVMSAFRHWIPSARVNQEVLDHVSYGTPLVGEEYREELLQDWLPALTVDDVTERVRGFATGPRRLVVGGAERDALPEPSALHDAVEAMTTATTSEPVPAEPSNVLVDPAPRPVKPNEILAFHDSPHMEYVFPNGLRVVTMWAPSEHVSIVAFRNGGGARFDRSARAAWSAALASGCGSRSLEEVRAALGADVSPPVATWGSRSHGFRMSVDGEDLESALSWIRLLLQEPRLDDEGVASSVDDLERRKRRGRTRDSMIASAVSRSLAAGADLEPLDGSDFESLVAESDDVQAQLDALVGRASDWTVVLTGWVEDREIREPLGAWLGTLEMSGSLEPPGALTPNPVPTGRMEETHPTPERADAAVVFHAPLAETQANREKLMLASRLLQTRATRALREEMGGTYHVDVWPIWLTAEAERRAGFEVQFATSPDRVDALTKRLREVVRELADADLDASVVGTVMHSMDRQTDRNLDYTYSELRAARLRGATFDPTRTFLKHTPLDVQELLHTVLTEHEVFEYRLVSESD